MDTWNRHILAAVAAIALLGACSEERGMTQEQPAPTPAGMNTDREQEDLEVPQTGNSPD